MNVFKSNLIYLREFKNVFKNVFKSHFCHKFWGQKDPVFFHFT